MNPYRPSVEAEIKPLRILLVEDNDVFRQALELLLGLQEGIEVVGAVSEGTAVVAACHELDPDVCVMDFRLPGMDGVEATIALRAACPDGVRACSNYCRLAVGRWRPSCCVRCCCWR